ncbi:hypothetical protein RUM43_013366, partial [Polyplax serrata]
MGDIVIKTLLWRHGEEYFWEKLAHVALKGTMTFLLTLQRAGISMWNSLSELQKENSSPSLDGNEEKEKRVNT